VHTLVRLPTGIFYAQGVKANVLFFDRKPAQEKPWTSKLWIYDLRTNLHFTLKENTLKRSDLDDFVACYFGGTTSVASEGGIDRAMPSKSRHERKATWTEKNDKGGWRAYKYEDLIKRDKINLDIFWLKDEALEDSANLPAPEIIAADIVEDLQAALAQFAEIANDLKASTKQ
jgi:type I restriction enzyme M protein